MPKKEHVPSPTTSLELPSHYAPEARYLLVPCRGSNKNDPEHTYAIIDQAGSDIVISWVDEQEADYLVINSEGQPWDQSYGCVLLSESTLLCSDCVHAGRVQKTLA